MDNIFPDIITQVIKHLKGSNFKVYLVGGALRDHLMNKPLKDYDLATDAPPEEILKLIPDSYYNNIFGTVSLSKGDQTIEITTLRKEGDYQDFRHPGAIAWTSNIKEDLARRDFTINAIAMELNPETKSLAKTNQLIDPFNGQQDLTDRLIRAVGDADKRFIEDALRLLRAVRFATQLTFNIEPKTFDSIQQNAPLLKNISSERVRDELLKILSSDYPYEGIVMLMNTNLLEQILPELQRCFGIMQLGPKHDRVYDIGEHSLLTLKFCRSADPVIRLACLLHDVGKPDTYKVDESGNVTFYNHEIVGSRIVDQIAKRLRLSKKQSNLVRTLVRWHMFSTSEHQTDSAIRRIIKNIGVENIENMLILREADRLGGGTQNATSWRLENFKDRIKQVLTKPFSISDLKVNGTDVMDILQIPPSPKVGEVLNKLFEEVQEDSNKNNREYLLDRIKQLS